MPTRRTAFVLPWFLLTAALVAQRPDPVEVPWDDALPPGTDAHVARALAESTRHGEYVDVALGDGQQLNCWVVHPERADKAPVVVLIHDIRGLSDWARAVGDQLAQDGFLVVVPDFLSGKGPDGGGTASLGGDAGQAIRKLTEAEITARVAAALAWGRALPNANGKGAVLGFCWGGTQSFLCAIELQDLQAAVVFYGSAPGATATTVPGERIARIAAPVLGCYGGNDARINATLGPTIAAMLEHGKPFEFHSFEGAGHGFTRNQAAAGGANRRAVQFAWPLALAFLRRHL